MGLFDLSHQPTGWKRRLLHAPTYLYRARLGFVFGHRLVMLEHRGRKSGTLFRTVIEVAGRTGEEWVCTSGTGPHADWYLNLRAGGGEAVWLGSKRHEATVRFLAPDESATVMADYQRAHPKVAAKLFDVMGVSYDGTREDLVRMMASIPMVAFTLASAATGGGGLSTPGEGGAPGRRDGHTLPVAVQPACRTWLAPRAATVAATTLKSS